MIIARGQYAYILGAALLLLLTACAQAEVTPPPLPTPTFHPLFTQAERSATAVSPPHADAPPTISHLFAVQPTLTPRPLPPRLPTLTPTAAPLVSPTPPITVAATGPPAATATPIADRPNDGRLRELVIFDDELNPNWRLNESWGISLTLTQTAVVYSGTVAAAVTPQEEFAAIFFTVAPETEQTYLRDDVLGVSLWLNSGDASLSLDEMAIAIIGSNAHPYWDADDDSVELADGEQFFSETRLYYLGFNQAIPPNQWIEFVVWLDRLPYDPDYRYITGIYIKSGDLALDIYYLDRLTLLLAGES